MLRFLAQCPCPRCLIKKSKIPEMGTKRDIKCREDLIRIDDELRQKKIEMSRGWIFEKGLIINGNAIDRVLQQESYVPTRVRL
jgi:hypothetical protein